MPANVESMFYVRETPWHGLGVRVEEALTSHDAITAAGLDWNVIQKPIYTSDFVCSIGNIQNSDNQLIPNYKANVRDSDNQVLGVVSDRYKIVQNEEAFAFTDALIGEGVRYETAGSLQGGKKVWLLAKLPETYIMGGERIEPFLVFSNSHDGSGAIKVCMTPIRVVCQNTLNLALDTAKRSWSSKHTVNIKNRLDGVRDTLQLAHGYMAQLGLEFDTLGRIKLTDKKVMEFINELIPLADDATAIQRKNVEQLRDDVKIRYFEAPDLKILDKNGYRFINAISDHATHVKPLRETSSYKENLFMKTLEGHPMIDKAFTMLKVA